MFFKSDVYLTGAIQGDIRSKGIHDEVFLEDKEEYGIVLCNNTHSRMKAELQIAGNNAGTFVVMGNSKVTIKRPVDIDKKFQYVTLNSMTADQVKSIKNMKEFNLVQVVVKYEDDEPNRNSPIAYYCEADGFEGGSDFADEVDGGTVLSKNPSGQVFKPTNNFKTLHQYDSYTYVLLTKKDPLVSSSGFILNQS